jgi:archaellum biogenesis ATPase FlaH
MHIFRISDAGLQAFPRMLGLGPLQNQKRTGRRLSMGIADLDMMMGGGIPEGDSILVAGASGTGKSILCTQFIAEGLRQGEAAIIAVFEERPAEYASRANTFGLDLDSSRTNGKLEILYLRPLDLTVDEALFEIMNAVERVGAKRLVIDSLAGFERALAPDFREDFEESLYRMFVALTGIGVTILSTLMLEESFVKPLCGDRWRDAQDPHGVQDARRRPQQEHSRVQHHHQGVGTERSTARRLQRAHHRGTRASRPNSTRGKALNDVPAHDNGSFHTRRDAHARAQRPAGRSGKGALAHGTGGRAGPHRMVHQPGLLPYAAPPCGRAHRQAVR